MGNAKSNPDKLYILNHTYHSFLVVCFYFYCFRNKYTIVSAANTFNASAANTFIMSHDSLVASTLG